MHRRQHTGVTSATVEFPCKTADDIELLLSIPFEPAEPNVAPFLELKKELGEDSTWVTGYANDVMAYVPSERILKEGGYEGGGAMLYYQMPSPWKSGVEQKLVDSVHALVRATREVSGGPERR